VHRPHIVRVVKGGTACTKGGPHIRQIAKDAGQPGRAGVRRTVRRTAQLVQYVCRCHKKLMLRYGNGLCHTGKIPYWQYGIAVVPYLYWHGFCLALPLIWQRVMALPIWHGTIATMAVWQFYLPHGIPHICAICHIGIRPTVLGPC